MKVKSAIKLVVILGGISSVFSFVSYGAALGEIKIRSGAKGYVGEIIPKRTQYVTPARARGSKGSDWANFTMGFSTRASDCGIGATTGDKYGSSIDVIPGTADYGIRLINEDNPSNYNYIMLAINGTIEANYRRNNSQMERAFAQLVHSRLVNPKNLKVKQFLCYRPIEESLYYFDERYRFSSIANITSYSVYASGNVTPGHYVPPTGRFSSNAFWVQDGITDPEIPGSGQGATAFAQKGDFTVTILQTCDIYATTPTKMDLGNYLADNFITTKLLKSELAGVSYNCNGNGDVYISFQALNPLKEGSKTQMELTPQRTSSGGKNPYIVTSFSPGNDALCQRDAEGAITYFEEHLLGKSNGDAMDNKNFYFNLCVDGKINSSRYSGAIEVAVMIE